MMRNAQNEHDKLLIQKDGIETEHMELYENNKILNEEIDKCLRDILQYERVNK